MFKGKTYNQKGFTLVEIVIALTVLVIGLVGVIAVIPLGQQSARDSSVITRSAIVASQKMAEVKSYKYEKIIQETPPFPLTGTTDDISWDIQIVDVLASDFDKLVTLPVQHLKKIVVTVSYKIRNKTKDDTFHSFVAQF